MKKYFVLFLSVLFLCVYSTIILVAQISTPTTIYTCGGEVSFVSTTVMLLETYLSGTSAPCTINTKSGNATLLTYPLVDLYSLTKTAGTWGSLTILTSGMRGVATNPAGTVLQPQCSIGDGNCDKNGHCVFVTQDDGTGGLGHCSETATGNFGNAPPQHGFDYDLAVANLGTSLSVMNPATNTAIIRTMNQTGGGFTDEPDPVTFAGFTGGSAIIGEERMPSQFPPNGTQVEHAVDITQVNFTATPPTATCVLSPNSCQFQPNRNWPAGNDALFCEHWYKPYDWWIAPWDNSLHVVGQDDQFNAGGSGTCTALGATFLQAGLVDWVINVSSTPSIGTITPLLPRLSDLARPFTGAGNYRLYGEFIKVVVDANRKAIVWGGHIVMVASSSVLVPDAVIDACALNPLCKQNHNDQVWLWVRADAGLEVDAVMTHAQFTNASNIWGSTYCGGFIICGCQHFSIDTTSGGLDFACDSLSAYMQGSRYAIPIVFAPLQFSGAPSFSTKSYNGSVKITGSVK